jgi:homocitrate synthase NifV
MPPLCRAGLPYALQMELQMEKTMETQTEMQMEMTNAFTSYLGQRGPLRFCDTTLRDGEQTAGVVFSAAEKSYIASELDLIGFDQIEVGVPAMGREECAVIRSIVDLGLNASLITWNRARKSDIRASLSCGVDAVAISLPVSDLQIEAKLGQSRAWVLTQMQRTLEFARAAGLDVVVSGEDSSRADPDFLLQYAQAAERAGAQRFRFCDTLGIMDPLRMYAAVRSLCARLRIAVELHTHNDYGFAEASLLAALHAGATWGNTTVMGLGERAGNAAMEPVVMALRELEGVDIGLDTRRFTALAGYVAAAANRALPPDRPVVGSNVFAHESGLHVHGLLRDSRSYESYAAEQVGNRRRLVIGKHSGRCALAARLAELGLSLSSNEAAALLAEVRQAASAKKGALSDEELLELLELLGRA